MINTDFVRVYPDPDLASAEEEKNRSKQCCFESCEDKQEDEEGVLLRIWDLDLTGRSGRGPRMLLDNS